MKISFHQVSQVVLEFTWYWVFRSRGLTVVTVDLTFFRFLILDSFRAHGVLWYELTDRSLLKKYNHSQLKYVLK